MTARELVAAGYRQISNKYRMVARLPEGTTGLQALQAVDSEFARDLIRRIEEQAADQYRRVHARGAGNVLELDEETFADFKR